MRPFRTAPTVPMGNRPGQMPVPVGLGNLPPFDPSRPGDWPTHENAGFFAGPPISGVPDVPGGPASVQAPPKPFYSYSNFMIQCSASQPALQQDPNRIFLLIQNQDTLASIYVSFGTQPDPSNWLVIPAGIGFVWDFNCPMNTCYVAAGAGLTVQPTGMQGTRSMR